MIWTRTVPPTTGRSVTHKVIIDDHEGYLTVWLLDDGRPGEVFIKLGWDSSTLSALIQSFCQALSLALQCGLPVEAVADRFRGVKFEPSGATNDPDIPQAASIIDYTARYLELRFGAED